MSQAGNSFTDQEAMRFVLDILKSVDEWHTDAKHIERRMREMAERGRTGVVPGQGQGQGLGNGGAAWEKEELGKRGWAHEEGTSPWRPAEGNTMSEEMWAMSMIVRDSIPCVVPHPRDLPLQ